MIYRTEPPRPDQPQPERVFAHNELSTWNLWMARIGVVVAFLILLTIPGWFALASYNRWRRGETLQPTAALFWGYAFLVLLGLFGLLWLAIGILSL
jgi:hypothetical protein